MAITFPMSLTDFQQLLGVVSATFEDRESQQMSGKGSGQILRADIGPRLWRGEIGIRARQHADAQAIEALLSVLRGPGASFFVHDPRRIGPKNDPDGSILSGLTIDIDWLGTNNREMRLGGFPIGFQLVAGDMLAFVYVVNGVILYALHRLVEGATADGIGRTSVFEVTPPLRPGVTVGTTVDLVRPACKAVMVPGSITYGTARGNITDGAKFQFIQTLG